MYLFTLCKLCYYFNRPALTSVIIPHNSIIKSVVNASSDKSDSSMASAKSIELSFPSACSHICVASSASLIPKYVSNLLFICSTPASSLSSCK